MPHDGLVSTALKESGIFGPPPTGTLADVLRSLPIALEAPGRYHRKGGSVQGGMGRILIVRDEFMGRDVVMKELLPCSDLNAPTQTSEGANGDDMRRVCRFLQEACITGQLAHPSIVPVYELGLQENGTPYYTMKYVRGRTLDSVIGEAKTLHERLGLLNHFLDLCNAIAYAHNCGVIHRDIKPSNVMLGEFGETIVLDWGIAQTAEAQEAVAEPAPGMAVTSFLRELAAEDLTRTGEYAGTPHYMAPERLRGEASGGTKRTDVYALGAVLYELLCGRRCFDGDSLEDVLGKVSEGARPSVLQVEPKAPADLAAICERALAHDPNVRYSSAKELARDIERFRTGAIVEAYQYTPAERLGRFMRRHWRGFSIAAAALTAIIAVTIIAFLRILHAQEKMERALYISSVNLAKASIETDRIDDAIRVLDNAPVRHRHIEWGLLHELAHPELLTLRYHEGPLTDAQYSPDGALIATCGHDGRLVLWDARTGARLRVVHAAEDLQRLDWSPDSTRVATACKGDIITIWDAASLTPLLTFPGYAPVFGGDGGILAAVTVSDKHVSIFNTGTGDVLHDFADSAVYLLWLDISPDGRWLAGGNSEGSLHVWDLETGTQAWMQTKVHQPSLRYVEFASDGRTLLSVGADRMARLWDMETGTCIRTFDGRDGGISGAAALTVDGQWLITGGNDRTARVWDVATGEALWQSTGYPAHVGFIAVSPDGQSLLTSDGGSGRAVFPVVPFSHQRTLKSHRGWVWTAVFSPDGSLLATGGGNWDHLDNRILLWDPLSGALRRTIETGSLLVQSLAFCDNGRKIAAASTKGKPVLYDVETGNALHTFPGHKVQMDALDVSLDGRLLVTTSVDKIGILWDLATREPLGRLQGVEGAIVTAAFHPSGRWLATSERFGWVRIWEVPSGAQAHAIPVAHRYEPRLAFSPDGRWLATGTMDGAINLWEVEGWHLVRTLEGHTGYVGALAFSSGSRRLVSGGRDNAVRIWDLDTGEQVLCIERHADLVTAVAFSACDKLLVTASRDGTAVVWPIAQWQTDGASRP